MLCCRVLELLPVDVDDALINADGVSRQSDASLQIPHLFGLFDLVSFPGPIEDDDIPAFDAAESGHSKMRDANGCERYGVGRCPAVDEPVDEQPVARLNRVFHGSGGNLEGGQYKAVDEQDGGACVKQFFNKNEAFGCRVFSFRAPQCLFHF